MKEFKNQEMHWNMKNSNILKAVLVHLESQQNQLLKDILKQTELQMIEHCLQIKKLRKRTSHNASYLVKHLKMMLGDIIQKELQIILEKYVTQITYAKADELVVAPEVPKIALPKGSPIDVVYPTGNYYVIWSGPNERVLRSKDRNIRFTLTEIITNGSRNGKYRIDLSYNDQPTRAAVHKLLTVIAPNQHEPIYEYLIWAIKGSASEFGVLVPTISTYNVVLDSRFYTASGDNNVYSFHLTFPSYNQPTCLKDYMMEEGAMHNVNQEHGDYAINEYDRTEY